MKFGSAAVPIYLSDSNGRKRYFIAYYRDGKRLRQAFPDLAAAKKEATFVAQRIQSGMQQVTDIKPHERENYAAAMRLLEKSGVPLVAAVEDYIFSPETMTRMLHHAPADLVPILAIGAFSGIRMAELNRLDWSAVDLDRRIIELRAGQAKTGSRRVIPITDNLAAWLEPLERKGMVVPSVKSHHRVVAALAASLKIEWPRNVLRHSFISYRIATVKSADQVALEAGNSPSIIFKNYRDLTTEEQADKWFGIVPKDGQWENQPAVARRKHRAKSRRRVIK